jgi:hypothetical protein
MDRTVAAITRLLSTLAGAMILILAAAVPAQGPGSLGPEAVNSRGADPGLIWTDPIIRSLTPDRGPLDGGTTVAIAGTNLAAVTEVIFGTAGAGAITAISDRLIEVTAPTLTVNPEVRTSIERISLRHQHGELSSDFTYTYTGQRPAVVRMEPSRGSLAGGTLVTFTGNGLAQVTDVIFGDSSPGEILDASPTRLEVYAPPGRARGPVSVTLLGLGGLSLQAPPFTYINRLPVLTSISPQSGSIRGGTRVEISGRRLAGVRSVRFGSIKAPILSISSTLIIVRTPPGMGVVPVTITTPNGSDVLPSAFDYQASG